MAKTSGPLMSIEASGSFAKTLTFAKNRGVQYVRQLVIPRNPQSVAQQTPRAAMGAAGRFNSYVASTGELYQSLAAAAPNELSATSYYAKKQAMTFSASKTAYETAGNATIKGYFDTAAASLGILPISIPGETPLVVPAGLILWNAYQTAYSIDPTTAPTTAVTASEANITTFVATLS